jgi:hypothetical protein
MGANFFSEENHSRKRAKAVMKLPCIVEVSYSNPLRVTDYPN